MGLTDVTSLRGWNGRRITSSYRACLLLCISSFLFGASAPKPKSIYEQSFQEILSNYLFINDFYPKEPTRKNSDELFWRYDIQLPKIEFTLNFDPADAKKALPATTGGGREYEHLNNGRVHYLAGDYENAKKIWLAGRQNFGKNYPYHRRNDYFIGLAFMQLANAQLKKDPGAYATPAVKTNLTNAATFFSWAFVVKKDQPDALLDEVAPQAFYTLAAIYFRYERYAAAYGAAEAGLDFLRKTGRKELRSSMRRVIAESHIKNTTYLEAVQELDTAIRQDPDPVEASLMFRRVADIYFSLNNYELAEENYAIANQINHEAGHINPAQYVLRGEALFWLGQFQSALSNFQYALNTVGDKQNLGELDPAYMRVAHLRMADIQLALKNYDKARLEYFRIGQEYRNTKEASLAKIRGACLELPEYDGNNVTHARTILEAARNDTTNSEDAIELAWACDVSSYTQRERTDAMVERVKNFAYKYPDSRFLNALIGPVKDVKASKLDELFKAGKNLNAAVYFEKTRKMLFPKVSDELSSKLFVTYVDNYRPDKAAEFYQGFLAAAKQTDLKEIRKIAFLTEVAIKTKNPYANMRDQELRYLDKFKWSIEPSPLVLNYLQRIRNTPNSNNQLPWIYNLAKSWAIKDQKLICGMIYPLISQMAVLTVSHPAFLRSELIAYVDQSFPKVLETDEACAISMLELELNLMEKEPSELAARYVTRSSWPMTKPLAALFWEVAELNAAAGKTANAREIWTLIRDKAPKDTAEFGFAKVRLDTSRTEYDGLWR